MTRVVLARHGETVWHAENRYAGRTDVELTALGRRQADALARWAGAAGLGAVWTSPLDRARSTAEPCAVAAGVDLQVDERLSELDFGDAEGLTAHEMHQHFPGALDAFRHDPVAHHLPSGEKPGVAAGRFVACLREIAGTAARAGGSNGHRGRDRVLVVAHTTVIRLALCELIGVPLRDYRRVFPRVGNCAITELEINGSSTSMLRFNCASFLAEDGADA